MAAPAETRVWLRPERDKPVRQGHPWIFSGAVARDEGRPTLLWRGCCPPTARCSAPGSTAPARGSACAWCGPGEADRGFFADRIAEAAALRQAVVPAGTTGYRLLNAEGDACRA